MKIKKKILLCPEIKKGSGTGHLVRCLSLREKLNAFIYVEDSENKLDYLPGKYKLNKENIISDYHSTEWDLIVLDRKETDIPDFKDLKDYGTVIGIDEGGETAKYLVYTLNTLPGLKNNYHANQSSIGFLDLPKNSKIVLPGEFKKILISFGGEDPEDLTSNLIEGLLKYKIFLSGNITIIKGFMFEKKHFPFDVRVINNPVNLKEQLYHYDLVFTSFGLTCFEALSAGVPVILFNPSDYHRKLSMYNMLPEIGVGKPDFRKLSFLLNNPQKLIEPVNNISKKLKKINTLDKVLAGLADASKNKKNICPACDSELNPCIARFELKSYFKCKKCGIIYQINFNRSKKVYNKNYFNNEYCNQYGKTYIDDFNKIKKLSYKRIANILSISKQKESLNILDIGCAYGPFLDACREKRLIPEGIDISADAVKYVKEKLNLKCCCDDFINIVCSKKYDVITMWFTIEHFEKLSYYLKKVNKCLKNNGLFSFSTPNSSGISGKKNIIKYLKNSPNDHFTVFSPVNVKKILKLYGFKVKKIKITGHHPERFIKNTNEKNIIWKIVRLASRIFSLGDTFEVYSVKIREI